MEGEEIGLVLARAAELRSKVDACISRRDACGTPPLPCADDSGEGDEEPDSLVGISDALESLEQQLSALQTLHQHQQYERETILNQIDASRKVLLDKLKDYRGQDWEVIQEASAFAGDKVEQDDALLLPPYSTHITDSFVLDDVYPSDYVTGLKSRHDELPNVGSRKDARNLNESEKKHCTRRGVVGSIIGFVAKSALTFVGVTLILSLTGYKPSLSMKGIAFEFPSWQSKTQSEHSERASPPQCPPGKVLVVEDGMARCLVKERVKIPFETDITTPNIRYGFG